MLRLAVGDRLLSLYQNIPSAILTFLVLKQSYLLQRISLSRIASWHRTRIGSNRLVNDK
ncbi:hypothetical protein [Nostoc sp. CCY 9925]|uniref:hypothetical protein n=1 Tax=Nostoc sp. CCY 9925 TaxID=3103865 RepID=UPI0039C68099